MIRIDSISIWGFKDPERTVSLKLSPMPISVIFGVNGSGKTTLLRILSAILSRSESVLLVEKVQKVELTISYSRSAKSQSRISHQTVRIKLKDESAFQDNHVISSHNINSIDKFGNTLRSEDDSRYDWSEFDKTPLAGAESILFGVNRGVISGNAKVASLDIFRYITRPPFARRSYFPNATSAERFSEELADYLNSNLKDKRRDHLLGKKFVSIDNEHLVLDNINIDQIESMLVDRYRLAKRLTSERVQKALFDTLSEVVKAGASTDELPDSFFNSLSKNSTRLIEALNVSAENTLRNDIIAVLKSRESKQVTDNSDLLNNPLLATLLHKMMIELETEELILGSLNSLISVYNDHVSPWKKLVVNQEKAFIELQDQKIHNLNELSSGERHLLSFLTLFIIHGRSKNFLMIDEPEISLNINWQRQILPLLNKLAPDSQLIVASHSPSVAKNNTNYLVELNP